MVFSKKFDYRKRTQERDLFFGLPSTPFLVFLSFIAILLIFNLIITNSSITGNVINDVNLTYNVYEPGEKLTGSFSLDFSQGDLIPKDSKIQVLISSPACAIYYVCSDGSLSEWYSYDHNRKTQCVQETSIPWSTCPDEAKFEGECKNMGYTCCNIGYGQGLYYNNLGCSGTQQCFDRCANQSNGGIKNITLEQFIQAYDSSIPYSGNFTIGTYSNINGLEPSGSGEGFAACQLTEAMKKKLTEAGAAVTIKATQNFPTGNAVSVSEPIIPIEPTDPTDLEMVSANYDYSTQDLTVIIRNNGEAVDSNNWFDVNLYWNWATGSGGGVTCPPTATSEVSITGNAASSGGGNQILPVLSGACLLERKTIETGIEYGEEKTIVFENYNLVSKNITVSINSVGLEKEMSNNNLTKYIGLPADLIINAIYYDYGTSQLSAVVKNIGGSTAENFYVQACKMVSGVTNPVVAYAVSSTQYCSVLSAQEISILDSNSEARISFGTFDLQGSTIKIKADSTGIISESNEANNENTTYIPTIAELPDIEVVNYSYNCGTKTISINLKNNGQNPTGAFSLAFCTHYSKVYELDLTGGAITGMAAAPDPDLRCNQLLIPSMTVESIAGGEKITVETTNSALDGALFTLDANPGRAILEPTYTNNRLGVSTPELPDFEVLSSITYSPTSDRLDFQVRNNGQIQGTSEITVCEMKTKLVCGYELQATTALAISDFSLTGNAITQPGCHYVTVCENIITASSMTFTLEAGATGSFSVSGIQGKSLRIIADKNNAVCETNENNNQQSWDYNAGTCENINYNYDGSTPSSCSGTYTNGSLNSYCNSSELIQYRCDSPDCEAETINCEYGCNSNIGACNQPPAGNCIDTDGGINYSMQGTCTDMLGNSFTDYCENGLVEYYCNSGRCDNKTYIVGGSGCYSCQNGACSDNRYSCDGWNNSYNLKLNAPPLNLVTPTLDIGYFILDISLVSSDGTIMSRATGEFMNNDTSYRYCANYQCKKGYGINIPDECDSDSDCGSTGGTGGGGGGGGGTTTACYDDWGCGTWSSCNADGLRTRECTRCTMSNTESEVCVYGCIEAWTCSDWTVCDESGAQTQICTDKNTCSARNSEYVAQRDCCVENWDCKWGTCQNGKQARVCTDNSNCGTGFLKPADETRECSGGFAGINLSSVPLGVKIAVPIAIIGGVLVSLFLIRRKPSGEIIRSGSKSAIQQVAKPAKANYPELTGYIKTAKGQGMNDNDIKKKLLDAGWPKDVVDSGFK